MSKMQSLPHLPFNRPRRFKQASVDCLQAYWRRIFGLYLRVIRTVVFWHVPCIVFHVRGLSKVFGD